MNGILRTLLAIMLAGTLAGALWADTRPEISRLASRLEQEATAIAESGWDHFKGWSGEISDREQGILFKSEAFAAGCRLFIRLAGENAGYYARDYLRTNLYNAFLYMLAQYRDLESEVRRADMRSSSLGNCREILEHMEREFSRWPSRDNLAYLQKKYVQARNRTVYMIEKHDTGEYVRRPFRDLASLYRFNYDLRRGNDPWKYLEKVEEETLAKMPEAAPIDMGFEGMMVMDQRSYPGRPVFRIQEGRKCPLDSSRVLDRLGGWSRVFEVPVEVLNAYPDGEPVR